MNATATDPNSPPRTRAEPNTRRHAVLAWMRLARVYHKIDRASAVRLRPFDLSVAQFDVIAQVGAHEGITQNDLAAALLVTKGNVCQLLDKLEARGLVERRPARTGRGNHLLLTDAGRALNRTAVPSQEDLIAHRFAALSPAEHQQLLTLLRKLDRSLDRSEED